MYVRMYVCPWVCSSGGIKAEVGQGGGGVERARNCVEREGGRFDPSVCVCLRDLLFEVVQLHGEGVLVHGGGERAAAPASAAVSVPVPFAV